MSTPANQKTEKEKKPTPRQGQATPKGKTTPAKSTPASQPERAAQRPAQSSGKTAQTPAKAASQPQPKAGAVPTPKPATPPAPKAATPPAPKPRDPSVARRDERREERRLEIQQRQQERRLELRQAKRQKLLIRYDLLTAPILLIGLVALFLVLHLPIAALVSGLVVLFGGFTVLAYATLIPTAKTSRAGRPRSPALEEAAVVESTINDDAQPPAAPHDEEAESKPDQ
jgi:hypothetical protein